MNKKSRVPKKKAAAKAQVSKKVKTVKLSKTMKVCKHLIEKKKITSLLAIKEYGATRLAAIIWTLRRKKGWVINSIDKEFKDRYGNYGIYAEYTLVSAPANPLGKVTVNLKEVTGKKVK